MNSITSKEKVVFNWSSGKDSAMALQLLLEDDRYEVTHLLTTVSRPYRRVSQHGVRLELLELQSGLMGIPLKIVWLPEKPTMEQYDVLMRNSLEELIREEVQKAAFGDIFLEDLREYREEKLSELNMEALFPIWKRETADLAARFLDSGFRARVVCVNADHLEQSFAGREYDRSFLDDLPDEVDPCGENGEFHTFVYDGPLFRSPIDIRNGQVVFRKTVPGDGDSDSDDYCISSRGPDEGGGLWFCELENR